MNFGNKTMSSHIYEIEQSKKQLVNQASFIKFNMKAVELQSQELKKFCEYDSPNEKKKAQRKNYSQKISPRTTEKQQAPNDKDQHKASKSMAQMHKNFRQIMKQTAKEQQEQRKQEKAAKAKHERAVMYLHHITRKIPPKAEYNVLQDKKKKERDYMNFRQKQTSSFEHNLLKMMVNQEIDQERKELLDLAERVGYLDPLRACNNDDQSPTVDDKNNNSAYTPLGPSEDQVDRIGNESRRSSLFGNRLKESKASQSITPNITRSPHIKQVEGGYYDSSKHLQQSQKQFTENTFSQSMSHNLLPPKAPSIDKHQRNSQQQQQNQILRHSATALDKLPISAATKTSSSLKPTPLIQINSITVNEKVPTMLQAPITSKTRRNIKQTLFDQSQQQKNSSDVLSNTVNSNYKLLKDIFGHKNATSAVQSR